MGVSYYFLLCESPPSIKDETSSGGWCAWANEITPEVDTWHKGHIIEMPWTESNTLRLNFFKIKIISIENKFGRRHINGEIIEW